MELRNTIIAGIEHATPDSACSNNLAIVQSVDDVRQ